MTDAIIAGASGAIIGLIILAHMGLARLGERVRNLERKERERERAQRPKI